MPRQRRRKIEVPPDTQPQFELGDIAEDIERRRKIEEREREQKRWNRQRRLRKEGRSELGWIQIQNARNPG